MEPIDWTRPEPQPSRAGILAIRATIIAVLAAAITAVALGLAAAAAIRCAP